MSLNGLTDSGKMSLAGLLAWGRKSLAGLDIGTAGLDARVLLAHVTKRPAEHILAHGEEAVDARTTAAYQALIEKRRNYAPVAYLTGHCEFMGLDFEVDENVLIPRPETEILVEETMSFIKKTGARKALDLCTGSGCIGVSLAYYRENLAVTASDISERALEVARRNATRLGVADRVEFVRSDLFEILSAPEKYDIIVSNPPYIPDWAISGLPPSVKDYEPRLALSSGERGVDFYERIFAGAKDFLNPGGVLMLEIGFDQGDAVREAAVNQGYRVEGIVKDLEGRDRVVKCQL